MKIKTKLLGGIYIYIIVLAILILGFTYYHHRLASKSIDCILYSENKLEITSQLETAFSKLIMPANDYLIHGNEEEIYLFKDACTDIDRIFKILEADNFTAHISEKERETISHLKNYYIVVRNHAEKIFSLPDPIGNAEGAIIMEEMDSLVDDMLKDMDEFHHNNRFNVLMEIEVIDNYFYKYMIAILSILIVTGLSSLLYGLFLTKLIISPIKRLVTHMGFVEKGDLSQRLYLKTKDEIGFLSNSFNKMIYTIQERTDFISKTSDYLENILNNTQDMVVTTDTNLRIVEFNTGAEQILGYTKEEVRGKSVEMFYLDINKKKELMKIIESEGVVKNYEAKARTKQGKDIDMSITISQLKDSSGNVIGTVDVGKDITARKKWEERLKTTLEAADAANHELEGRVEKRTAEIQQLLQQKDVFVNQLSHDLKTPLTPLVALLPMIEKRTKDPESKRMLNLVMENVGYMRNLTEMILALARLNAPSVKLNLEEVDISGEIQNIITSLSTVFKRHGLSIVNNIVSPVVLNVDRILIKELLHNLVSNAVKYTDGRGTVTFDSFLDGDNMRVFSVTDTGVGMTSEQIEHVFEEFYKADDSRNDRSSTGLGLTLCRRIVEKHGGSIWAESPGPGNGITMNFTLPNK